MYIYKDIRVCKSSMVPNVNSYEPAKKKGLALASPSKMIVFVTTFL